ncbi:MAG TPA: MFS transporter [Bryobacteraceae bacterium]|nr:MFS transporter [Bryobacteraceae bacterium]
MSDRRTDRRARLASSAIFLAHGLIVATWISRIPSVETKLSLSHGMLGIALLCIAIGSMLAMPVAGALIGRYGSKRCTVVATLGFCVSLLTLGLAWNPVSLGVLLVLYGAGAGAMDVSMNSQGVTVETYCGRRVMSGFHALFSVGGMLGSFAGGAIAAAGVPVSVHFAASAVVNAMITLSVLPWMLDESHEASHSDAPMFALPRGPVLGMGALTFCFFLCEGAIADWTAVFLRDALAAGPAAAASGYAAFSAAMAVGRFAGDAVTERFGPVRVIRVGGVLGAAGLLLVLLAASLPPALVGLVATGLGYAAIVPIVFGAAGRLRNVSHGAGIAAVTTMGFTGFLTGPPAIGWIAEWTSLRFALGTLVVLSLAGALLAPAVRQGEADRQ